MPTRVRELGITPGTLPPGPLNALPDVPGVLVGHTTLDDGDIHTGVTAILPPGFAGAPAVVSGGSAGSGGGDGSPASAGGSAASAGVSAEGPGGTPGCAGGPAASAGVSAEGPGGTPGCAGGSAASAGVSAAGRPRPLPAAIAVGNGYGKLVGSTQVDELGVLETPILLTGTLSVFRVADALVSWLLERDPEATSLNPVVGETNDGFLSDIRRRPITADHVFAALDGASADLPAEGCVGAGTGTAALGFKAGIGTSSRLVADQGTVGVLAQANFSGTLTVLGTPIAAPQAIGTPGGNSCMIVVATDVPLDARQLGRLARRAIFAMGRVGSDYAPGSGDYAIAFSTAADAPPADESSLGKLFQAVTEATEEALLNSLTMAHSVTGHRGNTRSAVPLELVAAAGR